MAAYIISAIIAYCLGSISFSIIFGKVFGGFDVRQKGSGNAGSTNVLRTVGKKAAILTLICDILKGVLAVAIAIIIGNIAQEVDTEILKYIAGLFAIIGHTFPVFFGFRGGKGVATALGAILVLDWKIALICLIFTLVLIIVTRMVSVGSIMAAILYPILTIFMEEDINIWVITISILIGLLIIFNHRQNIKRIKNGNENKIKL